MEPIGLAYSISHLGMEMHKSQDGSAFILMPHAASWLTALNVGIFKAQTPRYENHTEAFPCNSQGVNFGKILSVFGGPKPPQYIGRFYSLMSSCTRQIRAEPIYPTYQVEILNSGWSE